MRASMHEQTYCLSRENRTLRQGALTVDMVSAVFGVAMIGNASHQSYEVRALLLLRKRSVRNAAGAILKAVVAPCCAHVLLDHIPEGPQVLVSACAMFVMCVIKQDLN